MKNFVHSDPEFENLLRIVAGESGIAVALVEKDYWVTHTLWAIHRTGLAIWFKGGTSLSKGFGLIQRFSEDLDLMIEHGGVQILPVVPSWSSANKGQVAKRRAFYDALATVLAIPDVRVEEDAARRDSQARGADYLARYPGKFMAGLAPAMSPFVRLEVGRARVVPYAEKALSSFAHDYLRKQRMLADYEDNRPSLVRCVHPLVTLFEKLDAMTRRYNREEMQPDSFVRHYEDVAQIIRANDRLPSIEMTAKALAEDMLSERCIVGLPRPDEPALLLSDPQKRAAVEKAYSSITPMFWGKRIPLDEACEEIRAWLGTLAAQ